MEKRLKGAVSGLSIALGMLVLVIIVMFLLSIASWVNEQYGREVATAGFVILVMLFCSILGFIYPGDD